MSLISLKKIKFHSLLFATNRVNLSVLLDDTEIEEVEKLYTSETNQYVKTLLLSHATSLAVDRLLLCVRGGTCSGARLSRTPVKSDRRKDQSLILRPRPRQPSPFHEHSIQVTPPVSFSFFEMFQCSFHRQVLEAKAWFSLYGPGGVLRLHTLMIHTFFIIKGQERQASNFEALPYAIGSTFLGLVCGKKLCFLRH